MSQVAAGEPRNVTADNALRLDRRCGTSPDLWTNLQRTYEPGPARRSAPPLSAYKRPPNTCGPERPSG